MCLSLCAWVKEKRGWQQEWNLRKKQERKDERPEEGEKGDEVKYKETKSKEPVCWGLCLLYTPGEKYSYTFRGPDISVACEELLVNLAGEQPHLMGGGSDASVTTHDGSRQPREAAGHQMGLETQS